MYLSTYYSIEAPTNFIKDGYYDIGCGGNVYWIITDKPVEIIDIFSTPYYGANFAIIFTAWGPKTGDEDDDPIFHDIEKYKATEVNDIPQYLAYFDQLPDLAEEYSDGEYCIIDFNSFDSK